MRRKSLIVFFVLSLVFVYFFLLIKKSSPVTPGSGSTISLARAGRYFFFDTRLSFNNTKSCGSCHDPHFAFTDGYRRSTTANGENVKHNSPSLINAFFHNYFDWANPAVTTLEKQQERPLFNEHPAEMGVKGNETIILQRIRSDSFYQRFFLSAFPGEKDPVSFYNITSAISAFERTLQSFNSPYDKYTRGDDKALSASAKTGMALFFSKKLNCAACHTPPLFTTASLTKNADSIYFNTGLYNVLNKNKYPDDDNGLAAVTGKPGDDGRFKTPSLRNVALTSPYMHDGSINTLEEVIDMYQNGGREIKNGPSAGDGRNNKLKSKLIRGFSLSASERNDLLSFLFSLTDSSALAAPQFQNPFGFKDK